jgi:hypothetical protein
MNSDPLQVLTGSPHPLSSTRPIDQSVKRDRVLWIVSLALVALSVPRLEDGIAASIRTHGNDFGIFFRAAECFRSGACDPYAITTAVNSAPNLLAPHGHLIFWPLLSLPLSQAWAVWLAASAVSVSVAVRLALKGSPATVALGLALVLYSSLGMATVRSGQLYAAMTLPLVVAWQWDRAGRRPLAVGAILGVLASIKPLLLLFGVWFLWRRSWLTAAAFGWAGLGCGVVGVLAFGVDTYQAWWHALGETAGSGNYIDGAILQTALRVFLPTSFFQPVLVSPALAAIAAGIGLVTVAGLTGWRPSWLTVTAAACLLSPKGWIHGGLWMAVLAMGDWENTARVARWLLVTAAALTLLPEYAPLWGQPNPWLTPTLGSLVCWMFLLTWIAGLTAKRV